MVELIFGLALVLLIWRLVELKVRQDQRFEGPKLAKLRFGPI